MLMSTTSSHSMFSTKMYPKVISTDSFMISLPSSLWKVASTSARLTRSLTRNFLPHSPYFTSSPMANDMSIPFWQVIFLHCQMILTETTDENFLIHIISVPSILWSGRMYGNSTFVIIVKVVVLGLVLWALFFQYIASTPSKVAKYHKIMEKYVHLDSYEFLMKHIRYFRQNPYKRPNLSYLLKFWS